MGRDRREVGHEIHVLSNMIGRKIDEEKRQRNMGDVSPVQTWVIRYLHDHKGQEICQRDLERDFNITRSTVTGILQLMEKNGIIRRESVDYDARLKSIIPTDEGRTLQAKVEEDLLKLDTRMLHGFTKTDEKTLIELLRRISQNLQ